MSGFLFTAAGVAAILIGNTGDSVTSILWTAAPLSLFGLLLVQLAGLGAIFFAMLAAAAAYLGDARVILPHSRAAQRRLFCCGVLCPRAHRHGLWGGVEADAVANADGAADLGAGADGVAHADDATGVGADAGAGADADAGAKTGLGGADDGGGGGSGSGGVLATLSQTEFMAVMGIVNSSSALTQWYSTPPTRTPPLLQALLPVAMIVATPPLSKLLLRDRKQYLSLVPAASIALIAASVVVSMLPTMLQGTSSSGSGESGADTLLWSVVYLLSQLLGAGAFCFQQLYLLRAGALIPDASARHVNVAMLRNLAYNQILVTAISSLLWWQDVLPWWGSESSVAGFSADLREAFLCSVLALGEDCPATTPLYAFSYLAFEVVYLVGAFMVSKDSAVFSALLAVAMTALLDVFWLLFPALNPAPGQDGATPLWSVLLSFALATVGIFALKRWESSTPVAAQFGVRALPCEVADVAAARARRDRAADGGPPETEQRLLV